jgi:predicted ATPase
MRIVNLKIAKFKNLEDFSIEFDEESFTTVVVGQNGTGKSNMLEALIIIFRNLDLGNPPEFKYQIDYMCRGNRIRVEADPARKTNRYIITVNKNKISYSHFLQRGRNEYLPNYVFGYYSGLGNRMEKYFETHQNRYYKDLINNIKMPLRPFLYARHVHSQFVLLAFFYSNDQTILDFLSDHLGIECLDSVLFIMNEPLWKGTGEDPRFWYAEGTVQKFLSKLYDLSLAPLRIKQTTNIGFRRTKRLEHLYLYVKDVDTLRNLANEYLIEENPSPQEFFKALESTYISELISEVRIRIKVRGANGSLTFRELSEGEQQMLMVLGLLRFTKEDESLFLLDEPDTHLNPTWSMQYISFLNDMIGDQQTSHIIMVTHDPLVVANLKKSQVRIFQRDVINNRIYADQPEYDPIKMDFAAILTSDIYGFRSIISTEIQTLLDKKRELAIKDDPSEEDLSKLDELNRQLDEFDFTNVVRDPLYAPFVRAMSELEGEEGLQEPVLTKEQREKRKKLATDVLIKLKAKRE